MRSVLFRFPDQVDPPYEPTKLLAIRRIRSLKSKPYWERRIMEQDLKLQEVSLRFL